MNKLRVWTPDDGNEWYSKLTEITSFSDKVLSDWVWMRPQWHHEPWRGYALYFLRIASQSHPLQKAIWDLEGPDVFYPTLYWAIWSAVEAQCTYKKRERHLEVRRGFLQQVKKIERDLSGALECESVLVEAIRGNKELCISAAPIHMTFPSGWVDGALQSMQETRDKIADCLHTLERQERNFFSVVAKQEITNHKVDNFILYRALHMAKKMLGEVRWTAIAEVMNAFFLIQMADQRIDADGLKTKAKNYRRGYPDIDERCNALIERRRLEFEVAMYNELREPGQWAMAILDPQ